MSFLLTFGGASKQHKRVAQKVFHQNSKAIGGFLGMDLVHSIRDFA